MKRISVTLAAVMVAGAAFGAETAPGDVVFKDGMVEQSLTGVPGDPANGRAVFANRKKGNCLACHTNSDMKDQLFHGEIGPSLDHVAERYDAPHFRAILTNSKMVFHDTIMPAFYRNSGFVRPMKKFEGKTILTAQEVEDVIAYLTTLK